MTQQKINLVLKHILSVGFIYYFFPHTLSAWLSLRSVSTTGINHPIHQKKCSEKKRKYLPQKLSIIELLSEGRWLDLGEGHLVIQLSPAAATHERQVDLGAFRLHLKARRHRCIDIVWFGALER